MTRFISLFHHRHFGVTLLIAIATGLISMCGQVAWLYSTTQTEALNNIRANAESMKNPATQALFELNLDMAHSVVTSLVASGKMQAAQILDASQHEFSAAQMPQAESQSSLFPQIVPFSTTLNMTGRSEILGTLKITPNRQKIISDFWRAARELAVIEFLRSFLLAFALALLFQFRIERPFQRLSRQILAADPTNPDHTLKLLKQSAISQQVGELGSTIEQFLLVAQQQLIERNQALGRIEELEQLQSIIRESEARYRSLISALSEGVVQQNQAGEILTYNEAALSILGLSREQLHGQVALDPSWQNIHEDGSPFPNQQLPSVQTLATGEAKNSEIMGVYQAGGVLKWLSINTQALFSENSNQPSSVVTTFTDITATRQAQLALQQAKETAERYLQAAGVVMLVLDRQHKIQLANARAAQVLGMPAEALIGMNFVEHFTPKRQQDATRGYLNSIFSANPTINLNIEGQLLTHSGDVRTFAWRNVCVLNKAQQIESVLCSGEDITEAQQLQASLQLRSHLLEQLSKEQSFNDFMAWLCPSLHDHIPSLYAAVLLPDIEPALLGAQEAHLQHLWLDYLDALEFGVVQWPEQKCAFLDTIAPDDASRFQQQHAKIALDGLMLEPIHVNPRSALGIMFDRLNPPDAHDLETIAVFSHIARLALERQAGNEMLQKTTLAALAASRAKSEFLANMSHEIRTPLNAVLGFSGLLQQTSINSEQQEYVDAIHTSGSALLTLINDLLDYSKIEAGHLDLEQIEFNLRRLIDDVSDIMAEKVAQKELLLYTHIDAALPDTLIGDPSRFSQVLLNLINNAVKFTANGHILLRISCISQQETQLSLRCEVIDTGIGIDFATSSKLFQPFIQADSSTTRQFGGTGLGLSICRRLVEAMHGEIGVESQIGHGSTFWFTAELGHSATSTQQQLQLQLQQFNATAFTDQTFAAAALKQCFGAALNIVSVSPEQAIIWPITPPELCVLDVLSSEIAEQIQHQIKVNYPHCKLIRLVPLRGLTTSRLENDQQINVPRPIRHRLLRNAAEQLLNPKINVSSTQHIQTRQHGLPILLVEDNPINQRVASLILQKMGYHVTIAGNGQEGLTLLEQHDYALILMDCQMPVMDGFSATRAIRALDSAKAMHPIVALTSNAFQEDRDACFAAGMDDFITKPVTAQALSEVIARWVKKETIADEVNNIEGI